MIFWLGLLEHLISKKSVLKECSDKMSNKENEVYEELKKEMDQGEE